MGGKSNLGGIERRTVVRAGAWSVPVVAVAVAAPAHACSPTDSLGFLTFAASYRNYNTNAAEPTLIDVTSTVRNNGSKPTATFTVVLRIPAGTFDSVTSGPPPTGYAAPVIVDEGTAGFKLSYQRNAPLPAKTTDSFNVTLTVGDTSAPAYRGWQGPAFAMGYAADGGITCNKPGGTFPVPATAVTTLAITGWGAVRNDTILWIGTDTVNGTATTIVDNTGRKAVGPIFLDVTVPKQSSGRFQSVQTPANPGNVPADWFFVGRADNPNSWTYTFRTNPATRFFAPDQLNGASTNNLTPPFRASITLTGNTGKVDNPTNITAIARATGAANSAQVSNNSE